MIHTPLPLSPPENQRTASCLLKNQFDKHELLNILEIPENANDCLVFWNDLRKILKLLVWEAQSGPDIF